LGDWNLQLLLGIMQKRCSRTAGRQPQGKLQKLFSTRNKLILKRQCCTMPALPDPKNIHHIEDDCRFVPENSLRPASCIKNGK
jgi:hypothetical protein